MRKINEIILHCSATREGQPVTVEMIDAWHKDRGWNRIGYHYVIYLDGSVHAGRAVSEAGAHCAGRNAHSIGICYVGGLDASGRPKDTRTSAQKESMKNLISGLLKLFPSSTVHGHGEFSNKACPCFDVKKEY